MHFENGESSDEEFEDVEDNRVIHELKDNAVAEQVAPNHRHHFKSLEDLMSECSINSHRAKEVESPPGVHGLTDHINLICTNRSSEVETSEDITMTKTQKLFVRWLSSVGMVDDIIHQYNQTLQRIVARIQRTRLDLQNGTVVTFSQVHMSPPKTWPHGNEAIDLTPAMCIEQKRNYYADVAVDMVLLSIDPKTKKETQTGQIMPMVKIGKIPVLIGSVLCYTRLRNPTDHELLDMGWCPVHPGGTYISNGRQHVIKLRENLRANKIIRYKVKDSHVCQLTSYGSRGSNKMSVEQSVQDTVRISVSGLITKENAINVFQLYRLFLCAYGARPFDRYSTSELISFTKKDDDDRISQFDVYEAVNRVLTFVNPLHRASVKTYLEKTITELHGIGNDFVYISMIKGQMDQLKEDYNSIRSDYCRITKIIVLSHIDNEGSNGTDDEECLTLKLNLLSIMIARFCTFRLGFDEENNRDSWAEKMVQSHEKISQLFGVVFDNPVRGKYKKESATNRVVLKAIECNKRKFPFPLDEVKKYINSTIIEDAFKMAFNKNHWRSKGGAAVKEISSGFDPGQNVLGATAQVTRMTAMMRSDTKNTDVRRLNLAGDGFICGADANESKNCGIDKARTVGCRISLERPEAFRYLYFVSYSSYLKNDNVRRLTSTSPLPFNYAHEPCEFTTEEGVSVSFDTPLLVHGRMMGWCNGPSLRTQFVKLRRSGMMPEDTSVVFDNLDNIFYLQCDSSRLMRPLLIVNEESRKLVIDEIDGWCSDIDELFKRGAIEYVDTYEQQFLLIAHSLKSFEEGYLNRNFTHCELEPSSKHGPSASVLALPDHQAGPRNAYAASMKDGELAVVSCGNQMSVFPTTSRRMCTANRAPVETIMSRMIGLNRYPSGKNVRIAIKTHLGYNQEDADVFNQSSIDLGVFDYEVEHTAVALKRQPYKEDHCIVIDEFCKPNNTRRDPLVYRHLDENGIARLNSTIYLDDCIIGKVKKYIGSDGKIEKIVDASVYAKKGIVGIVDRIQYPVEVTNAVVRVRIYESRSAINADKRARGSQKFTGAKYEPAADMPRDVNGIPVDVVIGPGALFRRKTCGLLIEMLMGTCAALSGKRYNVTSFGEIDYDEMNKILKKHGYAPFGNERLIDGVTGMMMEDRVFLGYINLSLLKHLTKDKYSCAGECPKQMVTHQPVKGRQRDGAQRLGDMELNSLVSNGASKTVHERAFTSSDGYMAVLCTSCGQFAYPDIITGCHRCNLCKEKATFGRVNISWSFKYFTQILSGFNIRTSIKTKPIDGLQ